jgi:hypothetical protein
LIFFSSRPIWVVACVCVCVCIREWVGTREGGERDKYRGVCVYLLCVAAFLQASARWQSACVSFG